MKRGAIVLVGGESRRMGRPKAWLPFGDETLLTRVLRLLEPLVSCRIVVAASDQILPELPVDVMRADDRRPGRGPLEGLAAGLSTGATAAESFYVSSCDVPLLKPAFVRRMFDLMQPDDEIVVPRDDQYFHPLAAVYHRHVLARVERLLAEDRLRPFFLFEQAKTRIIDTNDLRDVDPQLESLRNLNTPDDYQAALRVAGLASDGSRPS